MLSLVIIACVVIVLLFGGAVFVGYAILEGWAEVKAAPREEMLMCEKHGPIRQNGTIDFFGQKFCGLCFHSKLTDAERGIVK